MQLGRGSEENSEEIVKGKCLVLIEFSRKENGTSASTIQKKRPPVPKKTEIKLNETDCVHSEEDAVNYDNPMYNAKTCLDFVPTLNGQNYIGVEGFIKRMREARAEC